MPKFTTRWQNNPVLFHSSKPSGNSLYHLKVQKEEERILEAILCINPLYNTHNQKSSSQTINTCSGQEFSISWRSLFHLFSFFKDNLGWRDNASLYFYQLVLVLLSEETWNKCSRSSTSKQPVKYLMKVLLLLQKLKCAGDIPSVSLCILLYLVSNLLS